MLTIIEPICPGCTTKKVAGMFASRKFTDAQRDEEAHKSGWRKVYNRHGVQSLCADCVNAASKTGISPTLDQVQGSMRECLASLQTLQDQVGGGAFMLSAGYGFYTVEAIVNRAGGAAHQALLAQASILHMVAGTCLLETMMPLNGEVPPSPTDVYILYSVTWWPLAVD